MNRSSLPIPPPFFKGKKKKKKTNYKEMDLLAKADAK